MSGSSRTSGSRCRTGAAWRPGSGCPKTPATIPCRPSWSTCPTARTTASACGTPRSTPISPATATRPSGWTLRGSGDSDGILEDEYLPLEQTDGVEVIRWLAAQPWCSGKVGIIGKSWGGFNGLQIAAHSPPELGAVISVASTDDRYADDVHYMGGCMLSAPTCCSGPR